VLYWLKTVNTVFSVPRIIAVTGLSLAKMERGQTKSRQPTTVAGLTTIDEFFHANQSRWAISQKNLSRAFSLGRGFLRLNTASCCRSARFSTGRVRRVQNRRAKVGRVPVDQNAAITLAPCRRQISGVFTPDSCLQCSDSGVRWFLRARK
jgi:hypothetical protein